MVAERIQWSEAEAVVRLWRQKNGEKDEIELSALAESLGISIADAIALLESSRRPKPRFVDRSGAISAVIAAVVLVASGVAMLALHAPSINVAFDGADRAASAGVQVSPARPVVGTHTAQSVQTGSAMFATVG